MARTADSEAWRRFLIGLGIENDLAAYWASFARPNVHLATGPVSDADTSVIGASKLGGYPDLPVEIAWPMRPAFSYPRDSVHRHSPDSTWKSQLLSFVAQINLGDIAKLGLDLPLPDHGLLSFFYDVETQPWGFDPRDALGTRVLYSDGRTSLQRLTHPEGKLLNVRVIDLLPGECLPTWDD
jgi:hypothetical protein